MNDRQTAKTGQETTAMEPSISAAWGDLARLGLPYRYGGRSPEGLFEFMIVDPDSGAVMTSGKGMTVAQAMVAAAGAGRRASRGA